MIVALIYNSEHGDDGWVMFRAIGRRTGNEDILIPQACTSHVAHEDNFVPKVTSKINGTWFLNLKRSLSYDYVRLKELIIHYIYIYISQAVILCLPSECWNYAHCCV